MSRAKAGANGTVAQHTVKALLKILNVQSYGSLAEYKINIMRVY